MSKKEELAREYSFNIPSEIYNTLETDADRLLWKSETERAFEAGYDSGKQENEHLVWQISEANYEKCKEIGKKEFLDRAAEFMKLYILNHDNIDIFEMEDEFRKEMEG